MKHSITFILIVVAVLLDVSTVDGQLKKAGDLLDSQFLPVDEAFLLSVQVVDQSVELRWDIAPGHYLYRSKLDFEFDSVAQSPEIAPGESRIDEYFGKVEVYVGELVVNLAIPDDYDEIIELRVTYQGCADAGLCYTPQKRAFIL